MRQGYRAEKEGRIWTSLFHFSCNVFRHFSYVQPIATPWRKRSASFAFAFLQVIVSGCSIWHCVLTFGAAPKSFAFRHGQMSPHTTYHIKTLLEGSYVFWLFALTDNSLRLSESAVVVVLEPPLLIFWPQTAAKYNPQNLQGSRTLPKSQHKPKDWEPHTQHTHTGVFIYSGWLDLLSGLRTRVEYEEFESQYVGNACQNVLPCFF